MKLKRRKIKRGRIEIIPMIDTIVILLIFYMTFSQFAELERDSAVKLPISASGEEMKKGKGQVIVNMYTADKISIGGDSYTATDLPPILTREKQKHADGKLSVILRGNKTMTYKDLSAFLNACAKAKIVDVVFATFDTE